MTGQKSLCSVMLLCSDLMLISSVSGLAKSRNVAFRHVASVTEVSAAISNDLAEHSMVRLLVDLAMPGLNLTELANAIPAAVLQQAVAYGPHVHMGRLEAARTAGFGHVMSRGAFSARFPEFVQGS